jgi:hypothetical protein
MDIVGVQELCDDGDDSRFDGVVDVGVLGGEGYDLRQLVEEACSHNFGFFHLGTWNGYDGGEEGSKKS